jgi:hypothetical protein
MADYLFVKRVLEIGNIKFAEMVLAHRIAQRAKQQQAIAMQNSEMNAKIQQESVMAKMQADSQFLQLKTQSKMALIEAENNKDIEVAIVKGEVTLEQERIKAGVKEELQTQQNLVDIYKQQLMKMNEAKEQVIQNE